ncbi:hypothetical protein GALMADRAFT_241755 [Galerina marginata CBS 339.88]|uniref:Uncharacterized protein n=1 Tax=Galerina marginata (strain CBS 339.88) TaxID=685588 RepID=A0A067TDA7_GALM3|nr:hypothetical protein GALMADRAFT_241755 [Galerina marginata CBS 339.88]
MQVQPEIKTVLSAVTELRELDFYFWDLKHADKDEWWAIPVGQKRTLAHEWMAGCPELWQVQFLDGFTVSK